MRILHSPSWPANFELNCILLSLWFNFLLVALWFKNTPENRACKRNSGFSWVASYVDGKVYPDFFFFWRSPCLKPFHYILVQKAFERAENNNVLLAELGVGDVLNVLCKCTASLAPEERWREGDFHCQRIAGVGSQGGLRTSRNWSTFAVLGQEYQTFPEKKPHCLHPILQKDMELALGEEGSVRKG